MKPHSSNILFPSEIKQGEIFNITSTLVTELGEILPNKRVFLQYESNGIWINTSTYQFTDANGETNFEVDTLNIKVDLIEKGLPLKKEFEIELDVKYDKVGFGSDNRIIAKIKNLKNYYIAKIIRISDVDGIEYLDDKSKLVVLGPNEIGKIFWDVNVDELNENFIYTIPFEIMNKNVEFIAKDGERKYNIKKDYEKKDLILECDKHEIEFYEWENAEIKCWTSKETEICFENECIFGKKAIFEIDKIEGRRSESIKANDEFFPVIINMIGKPEIEIIGEAVKNISMDLKNKYPRIEWKEIAGTRDKMIHHYFGVDLNIIFSIIKNNLPILKNQILKIEKKLQENKLSLKRQV